MSSASRRNAPIVMVVSAPSLRATGAARPLSRAAVAAYKLMQGVNPSPLKTQWREALGD